MEYTELEKFLLREANDNMLDDDAIDLLKGIRDLSEKIFNISMDSSDTVEKSNAHIRMYYGYREFVESAIDVILMRCTGGKLWRNSVIENITKETEGK